MTDSRILNLDFPRGVLFALLLPTIAAAGAKLQSMDIIPYLAYAFIFLASLTPLLMASGYIPSHLWPITIYGLGLGVSWHTTLVTSHLWGWDIHYIYYLSTQVQESPHLLLDFPASHAALLTITWFSGFIGQMTGLSIITVFKWIFPLLTALTPVIIYLITRHTIPFHAAAPIAAAVYIFFYRYFKVIPSKQAIGMLFLAFLIYTYIRTSSNNTRIWKSISLILASGLILTHYGTTMIYLGIFTAMIVIKFIFLKQSRHDELLIIMAAIGWTWYYLTAVEGLIITAVVEIGIRSVTKLLQFMGFIPSPSSSTSARSGIGYISRLLGDPGMTILGLLTAVVLGLIAVGVIWIVYSHISGNTHQPNYLGLALGSAGLLAGGTFLTFGLGYDRLVALGLVFLAPLTLPGALALQQASQRYLSISITQDASIKVVAIILASWFIFSSGLAFLAIPQSPLPAYALGVDDDSGWQTANQSEVHSVRWMDNHAIQDVAVYGPGGLIKNRDGLIVVESFYRRGVQQISPSREKSIENCGAFFTTYRPMTAKGGPGWINPTDTAYYNNNLITYSKIYHSGSAMVYNC